MTTWLGIADDDPYGVDNLPYAVAVDADGRRRPVVRIGDHAVDLAAATRALAPQYADLFAAGLRAFLAAGRPTWHDVRGRIISWLTDETYRAPVEASLCPVDALTYSLPFRIGDYVDFYASERHATNCGLILRPGRPPLRPNWKRLPVGYHGRSGTVVVSGTEVRRPAGLRANGSDVGFGPSRQLDLEAEVGFVVGAGSAPGRPLAPHDFDDHVFGVVLLNDWSARDIQSYEYVPLGPFLGKSFATSISAWITPLEALSAARVPTPRQDPAPAAYLDEAGAAYGLDLSLEVALNGQLISQPPFAGTYWSAAQMLAHLTVNGAPVRSGDLYGSGAISGTERAQCGSLLELTWGGTEPIALADGTARSFLADGDEVVLSATVPGWHGRLAIGEVRGTIVR